MPLFCTNCNNLLTVVTTADSFYFKCISCQEVFEPTATDTLRREWIKGDDLLVHKTILQNAGRDPANPKVYRDCACGARIAKQVRLGDDMRLINICTGCDKQTIEGLN